jgi:hypothetical protein
MGVVAALLALVALEGSALWTRANLTDSMVDDGRAAAAISRLRVWHSERVLLKACYEGNRGTTMATDISGWMLSGWKIPAMAFGGNGMATFDSEKARDVFFRVIGKPFNSLKPPDSSRGTAGCKDHGLTPADGDATPQIPSVPEPSSSLLVMLAAAAALLRRKREV